MVKQQRRYGSEWYLENDEGDVAWVAPMVKEHIERLEAENEKLRELVALMRIHDRVPSIEKGDDLGRWVAESAEIERLIGELGVVTE